MMIKIVIAMLAVLAALGAGYEIGASTHHRQTAPAVQQKYAEVIFSPTKFAKGTTFSCTQPDKSPCAVVGVVEGGFVYDLKKDGRIVKYKENGHYVRYMGGADLWENK
jgi:hypothetical protein